MNPPFRQCAMGVVITGNAWWIGMNMVGPNAVAPTFDPPAQARVIDNFKQNLPGTEGDYWRWSGTLSGERTVVRLNRGDCVEFYLPSTHGNPALVVDEWAAGDWNFDGNLNSGDISAFLESWIASAGSPDRAADYNLDNQVNSADISAFLTAWINSY